MIDFSLNPQFQAQKVEPLREFERLFQKKIKGFDCKIKGQALEAVLRHSLGGLDRQAQKQSVSDSNFPVGCSLCWPFQVGCSGCWP